MGGRTMKNVKLSYNEALGRAKKYNQDHLLQYFEELSNEEKQNLLQEIGEINFDLIKDLYENNIKGHMEEIHEKIEPMEQSKELHNITEE